MSTADHLQTLLRTAFAPGLPDRLGVAVSGGGDSVALLHLLNDWRKEGGPALEVVTVDHGLRPEAADEAAQVAKASTALGLPHETLRWERPATSGNLPHEARRARYGLMADWAKARRIGVIALGHTADDQAETFLMRLARGSGVDGLSAMAQRRRHLGLSWVRPLLWARREELRAYLSDRGVRWIDDPTNDDLAYERVRARQALPLLAPLGITREGLIATANRLSLAREVLGRAAQDLGRQAARFESGDVILDSAQLERASFETQMRLLAQALIFLASADYRPRFTALTAAYGTAVGGSRVTLHGCLIMPRKGGLHITREAQAVATTRSPTDALWDGRWRLSGPHDPELEIRALGEAGLAGCPTARMSNLPHASLLASPAVWRGTQLIAAPLAGNPNGWVAEPAQGLTEFLSGLIVH